MRDAAGGRATEEEQRWWEDLASKLAPFALKLDVQFVFVLHEATVCRFAFRISVRIHRSNRIEVGEGGETRIDNTVKFPDI